MEMGFYSIPVLHIFRIALGYTVSPFNVIPYLIYQVMLLIVVVIYIFTTKINDSLKTQRA